MSRIYLHIGLPKTATSTLQSDVFSNLDKDLFDYIGTKQPRALNKDSLCSDVLHAISSGENVSKARRGLIEQIQRGRSIDISEEMVTVSQSGIPWQLKLRNLFLLLNDLDYKLLITVRDPVVATYSFYTELYPRYKNLNLPWAELAVNNNDFKIYHYEYLFSELEKNFSKNRIFTAKFEDIIVGDLKSIGEFLGRPECFTAGVTLNINNSKKSNKYSVFVPKKISFHWLRLAYQKLGGENNFLLSKLKLTLFPLMQKVQAFPIGYEAVQKASKQQQVGVRAYLQARGSHVQARYGIQYFEKEHAVRNGGE